MERFSGLRIPAHSCLPGRLFERNPPRYVYLFLTCRDDIRHHECNVCKAPFTCPPPTRHELMESFTGAEIAALICDGVEIAM